MPSMFLCTDYGRAEGPYDIGGKVVYSFRTAYVCVRCYSFPIRPLIE